MKNIVSFEPAKKEITQKGHYSLTAIINVELRKYDGETCRFHVRSSTPNVDELASMIYISNIASSIAEEVPTIKIKSKEHYEACFTIFYYSGSSSKDIKYVFSPNLSKEKIAEYMYLLVSNYIY